jgi:hypothetical protein
MMPMPARTRWSDGREGGQEHLGYRGTLHAGLLGRHRALNIRQPMEWSVATKYVPAMIEFAEKIADRHCYELESGLYFDVSTVAIMVVLPAPIPMKVRAASRPWKANATPPISPFGARPRRAKRARWNGTARGAGALRAGIWNAR